MRFHKLFVLVLLFNFGLSYGSTQNHKTDESNDDSVIKILAIGNSFSQDAIETYLFELAQAENINVVIGNLYIGGASLDLHWDNAKDNKTAYYIDEYAIHLLKLCICISSYIKIIS